MQIKKVSIVAPTNPYPSNDRNFLSSSIKGLPTSNPNVIHIAMNMAANGDAGIPNNTVGIKLPAFCALLAPSHPASPLGLPTQNFSFGFALTVAP